MMCGAAADTCCRTAAVESEGLVSIDSVQAAIRMQSGSTRDPDEVVVIDAFTGEGQADCSVLRCIFPPQYVAQGQATGCGQQLKCQQQQQQQTWYHSADKTATNVIAQQFHSATANSVQTIGCLVQRPSQHGMLTQWTLVPCAACAAVPRVRYDSIHKRLVEDNSSQQTLQPTAEVR